MRDSIFGWEIDHICPVSLLKEKHLTEEIIDNLVNLRPLQHQNNASKSNDYPSYMAVVTSDGNKNVYKEQSLTVNSATRKKLEELYSL